MWLMTPHGFLSAVAKGGDGVIMVRARDRQSLEHFCDIVATERSAIAEGGGTDYPFRVVSNEPDVEKYAVWSVRNIKYSNFKDEAKRVRGTVYAGFLSKVWSAGWALTPFDVQRRVDEQWKALNPHYYDFSDVENEYPGAVAFSDMSSLVGKCDCCGKKIRKCKCTDDELEEFWDSMSKDISDMTDAEYRKWESLG